MQSILRMLTIFTGGESWLVSLLETGLYRPLQLGAEGKTSWGCKTVIPVMARIMAWSLTFTQTVPKVLSD